MSNNLNQVVPKFDFVAIDIEYADSAQNICQVGLVVVHNLDIWHRRSWLVCPPGNHYEERFMAVHHITPEMTATSPGFREVWPEIEPFLRDRQIWAHNAVSVEGPVLEKNLRRHGIEDGPYRIYDSRDLFRRPDCEENKGNGLEQCCLAMDIPCENHHDALSDAEMCARLLIAWQMGIEPEWDKVPQTSEELRKFHQTKRTLHLGEFTAYYNDTSSGEEDVLCELSSTYTGAPMRVVDVFDKGDIRQGENEGRVDLGRIDITADNPLRGKRVVLTGMFQIRRDDIKTALEMMGAKSTGSISSKTDAVIIGTKNVGFKKLIAIEEQEAAGHHIVRVVGDEDLCALIYGDGVKFFH